MAGPGPRSEVCLRCFHFVCVAVKSRCFWFLEVRSFFDGRDRWSRWRSSCSRVYFQPYLHFELEGRLIQFFHGRIEHSYRSMLHSSRRRAISVAWARCKHVSVGQNRSSWRAIHQPERVFLPATKSCLGRSTHGSLNHSMIQCIIRNSEPCSSASAKM